jgi:predicted nucleic acid-binding protein
MNIMFDTNIYDLIIATPGMAGRLNQLTKEGKLVVLCTHIQEDELARIPDEKKRQAIAEICRKKVTTSGAVWGVSKWDLAPYSPGENTKINIEDIRKGKVEDSKDALIGATSERDADVLVTEDKRFMDRMKSLNSSCEIWDFAKLQSYLFNKIE